MTLKKFSLNAVSVFGDFLFIKDCFVKREFLFLLCLLFSFAYLVVSTVFGSFTGAWLPNSIIVILFFLVFILSIKRRTLRFDPFVFFWLLVVFLTTIIDAFFKNFSITLIGNALTAVCFYQFYVCSEKNEKRLLLASFYLSYIFLLVFMIFRYVPLLISSKSTNVFDDYFGNIDGVSNSLTFLIAISFFYVLNRRYFSLFWACIALLFLVLMGRRTALLYAAVLIICFLFCFFKKKRILFFSSVFLLLCLFAILINIPALSSVKERVLQLFNGTITTSADTSARDRIALDLRSFYFGLTNLFRGYGFNGLTNRFNTINTHDTFGDIAFAFGGFFSLVVSFFLLFGGYKLLKSRGPFRFLAFEFGLFIFLIFLLGFFLGTRNYCLLAGVAFGLASQNDNRQALQCL